MKRKINISPLQVQKLLKKIIKEDIGELEVEQVEESSIIKEINYKGGKLVLEYETMFGSPRYIIYFDSDDERGKIVSELNPDFFEEQMATTILDYIKTRE